jgi:hypothetical protein
MGWYLSPSAVLIWSRHLLHLRRQRLVQLADPGPTARG